MDIKLSLITFVNVLCSLITYAILARIILSWVYVLGHKHPGKVMYFLYDITNPVINLAKKLPHVIGMIDLSPLIALLAVDLIRYLLLQLIVAI